MMAKQLLETYFKKEEIPEVQRKIEADKNFKDTFEKVKKRQIDISLDNLQARVDKTKSSFEERFEAFKKAVLEAEEKQKSGAVEVAEKKAKEILEEKKKELDKKLKAQANKKVSFIGEFLYDWAKDLTKPIDENAGIFDKLFGKIGKMIGMAILGFLGLKKGYEQMQNLKVEKTGGKEDDKKKAGDKKESKEGEEKGKETNDKIERTYNGYSFLGIKFLEKVSPSSILYEKEKNSFSSVLEKIKSKKTYGELKNIREKLLQNSKDKNIVNEIKKDLGIEKISISPEHLLGVLDVLVGENSKFVIEEKLRNIDGILDRPSFRKTFGDKYDYLKGKNINNLKYNDILFLLGYSLPVSVISKFTSVLPNIDDLEDYKKEIEEEVENRKDSFFSKEFLEIIGSEFNSPSLLKGNELEKKFNEKIKKYTPEKQEKLKQELEKFIAFKNSVLSIMTNSKFSLTENFEDDFIDKTSAKDILELYILFDKKNNLMELQGINKILMYLWISSIPKDQTLRNKYLTELVNKSAKINSNYLTEEEKNFLVPLLKQAGYEISVKKAAEMAENIKDGTKTLIIKSLNDNGINIPEGSYNYIDYAILGILVGGNYLIYKLPLPLPWKIALGGVFSGFGATELLGILNEKGVLKEMLVDTTLPKDVKEALKNLKEKYLTKS